MQDNSFFDDDQDGNRKKGKKRNFTTNKEKVIRINGQDILVKSESWDKDSDGKPIERTVDNHFISADGRIIPPDEYTEYSWTGLMIPTGSGHACLNPFLLHDFRRVFIGIDGLITEFGNVLCIDCLNYQAERLRLKKLLLFLYRPEVY